VGFEEWIDNVGKAVDAVGVAVIVIGAAWALGWFAVAYVRPTERDAGAYRDTRQRVGRSVLLGLEILVAADIVRTVAVSPSFESVGVLAAIVAIRTVLSVTLEMEISGRWPWQHFGG
jgi:uncharacterized membrane protein